MSSIIFINPDIENCDLINADHTLRDNLSSLIELNNDCLLYTSDAADE